MLGSPSGFDRERLLACLGKESVNPSIAVRDQKIFIPAYANRIYTPGGPGYSVLLVKDLKMGDARINVNARGNSEAGIVMRFQDRNHYLLAMYGERKIYFQEVSDGIYGPQLDAVDTGGVGETIHLAAELDGQHAAFTVTDGTRTISTSHIFTNQKETGQVGLYHGGVPDQTFDDFEIVDPDCNSLFIDKFDRADGHLGVWDIFSINYPQIEVGLAKQVDAIAWHPYQNDPESPEYRNMRQDVEAFKKECKSLGFNGQYGVTEWAWYSPWTEIEDAKYTAQFMVINCGLNLISLYNETVRTLRGGFQRDPISPGQPKPVYYVLRSISTVLDGFQPSEFPVSFSGEIPFECYTFRNNDHSLQVACWIPGKTHDGIVEERTDVYLQGVHTRKACVVDVMNGTEQELNLETKEGSTLFTGMLIKDYPTFIRLVQ